MKVCYLAGLNLKTMNATQKALDMLADIVTRKDGPSRWLEEAERTLAAAKEEQDDPYRPRFRSAVSGLWYTKPKAAGDIDIVEVGGVKFFPPGEGEEQAKEEQANGSGLTVEGVMDEVMLWMMGWCEKTWADDGDWKALHNALEDLAGKSGE